MSATIVFVVGLVLVPLAWGTAQIFDCENKPPTMTRYFMAKILPLSLGFSAVGAIVVSVAMALFGL